LSWSVHRGRKGHVKAEAQQALLGRIAPLIDPASEVVVTGDSAFGQVKLMRYLRQQRWHFVLRSCGHYQVKREGGNWRALCRMSLSEGQTRYVGAVRFTELHALAGVFLVMHWGRGEDEPWYLIASRPVSRQTLRHYRVRMWTEALYGDLKGHGFDLEATHLDEVGRLERLVLGVCLVFVWLLVLGSVVVKRGLRSLVDRKSRRDKSYFRLGWDYLERRLRLGEPIPIRFTPVL
ncbi:MAG: transposase, partial [Rhodothermales bacterium]